MNNKIMVLGALTVALIVGAAGGTALNALQANAQSVTSTPQNQQAPTTTTEDMRDPSKATHVGSNGVAEKLLTGDTAEKVKAAALAAVPGGTIDRVETDAEGSPYEAHMTKSDGTRVTLKFDNNFKVTATETGGPGRMKAQ